MNGRLLIIKKAFEKENVKSDEKRLRFLKYLELEIIVYDWFKRNRVEIQRFRGQSSLKWLRIFSIFSKIRAI